MKSLPKELFYWDHKHFNDEYLKKKKKELHTKLGGLVKDYDLSENIFLEISNVHAPVKEKI